MDRHTNRDRYPIYMFIFTKLNFVTYYYFDFRPYIIISLGGSFYLYFNVIVLFMIRGEIPSFVKTFVCLTKLLYIKSLKLNNYVFSALIYQFIIKKLLFISLIG